MRQARRRTKFTCPPGNALDGASSHSASDKTAALFPQETGRPGRQRTWTRGKQRARRRQTGGSGSYITDQITPFLAATFGDDRRLHRPIAGTGRHQILMFPGGLRQRRRGWLRLVGEFAIAIARMLILAPRPDLLQLLVDLVHGEGVWIPALKGAGIELLQIRQPCLPIGGSALIVRRHPPVQLGDQFSGEIGLCHRDTLAR